MSTTTAPAASPPPAAAVVKSGWGTKQGSFITNWKRRFFVLREVATADNSKVVTHLLLYYKSENEATTGVEPTGAVQLIKGETTVKQVDSPSKAVAQPAATLKPCLKIESPQYDVGSTKPKPRRVFYMMPDEDASEWREAILEALANNPSATEHTPVDIHATDEPKSTTRAEDFRTMGQSASNEKSLDSEEQDPAVEVEFPPSAKFWIDGTYNRSEPELWKVEAPKVVPWLTDAIINAHRNRNLKRAAVQLLLVEHFTQNLGALNCWVPLRIALMAQLTTLGAQLHDRYTELDLGNALSDKRVGCDTLQYHARLSTNHHHDPIAPLSHADLLPGLDDLFDFAGDPLAERTLLAVILMISLAVDAMFQQKIQRLVRKFTNAEHRGAQTKQYARALNKALSDHLGKPRPRTAYNIDTVRALLMVSDPTTMIEAFRLLVDGFDGVAKVKNLFVLPEHARTDRYHLLTLMVTAVVDSNMTFGEMANDPRCQQLFDAFATNVPHAEPKERWERIYKGARAYLNHPSIANEPVCTFGEVQIILKPDARIRKMMHLPYKAVRAETPRQLYDDFWQSYGNRPVEVYADILFNAAYLGQVSVAAALVDSGANVDERASNGSTPLKIATERNHLDVVQLLLDRGATVNSPINDGVTPLFAAAQRNLLDVSQLLVDNNAAIDQATNDGATPLSIAAQSNALEVVKFLVDNNAAIDQSRNDKTTPLFIASQNNHLEVVKFLVANHAAIDQATNDGATPLFVASQLNHLKVVQFLVANHATINQGMTIGATPLYMASQNNDLEVVKFLVANSATIDQATNDGATPLFIASQNNSLEAAKFLIVNNAAIDQVRNDGRTPLNSAASNGNLDIVKVLVEAGAGLNAKSNSWGTPLKGAIDRGKVDVVEYLRQHDAKVD